MDRQLLYPCPKWVSETDFGRDSRNLWRNAKNHIFIGPVMVATIAGELKHVSARSDGTVSV